MREFRQKLDDVNGNQWEAMVEENEYRGKAYFTWRLLKNGHYQPTEVDSVKQKIPKSVIAQAHFYTKGVNDAFGFVIE